MTRIFDEKFEATGYDESGWSETVGSGSTVDEDYAVSNVDPEPSGWETKGLRCVSTSVNQAYAGNSQALGTNKFFYRTEVVIVSEALANGQERRITQLKATGSNAFRIILAQESGDLIFRFEIWEAGFGGSGTILDDTTVLSLGTRYRVELKWDIDANAWEILLDGVSIFSGTLTAASATTQMSQIFRVGLTSGSDADVDVILDLIAVDDAAYPGAEPVSAAVTGTATATIDEDDVVTGGKTIILTLTNTIWVASGGTFDAIRQDIIDGLDSAQVEATGWNAEVRDKEVVGAVVRTSDLVVTITLTAQAAYDITAQEVITATIPASAIEDTSPITAAPTFTVDFVAPPITAAITGTAEPTSTETQITTGGRTIIITLTADTWVASGAAFNAIRQDIIDGLDSAQSETLGWNAEVRDKEVVGAVVRTSPTVVTITLTAQPGYDITATETITVTVPASALVTSGSPIVSTPTFLATSVAATAVITGTATATINESDVVTGAKTIIITLANGSWVASGATFNAERQAIIDGLDSAQVEGTGWNAEVRDKEVVGAVVRTSQRVVTITLTGQAAYDITAQETITVTVPASAINETGAIVGTPTFTVDVLVISAAITGTISPSSTEAQIVAGGRTILITLTDDTWVAEGGAFNAIRQDIIDGLDSAQAEGTGWNAEVRDKEVVTAVVRTSATLVTITLSAQAAYNITDTETITVTVPASALFTSGSPVVATPTFAVTEIPTAVVTGTAVPTSTEAQIVTGGRTIIITLMDDEWVAAGATFNAVRQAIIDGLDSAQVEATGWNAEVRDKEVVTAVVRTSPTVVTITLTAQAAYDITGNETITVTVPASALDQTALPITATPTLAVTFISPIPGPGDPDPFASIAGNGLGGISRNHTPPGVIINR